MSYNRLLQPQTGTKKWSHLFSEIDKGEMKIPNFQRKFVWKKDQIAKLTDSIIRGYPIGTFIIWRTKDRLMYNRNIGNVFLRDPNKNEYINYILDGQQRITSLFALKSGAIIKDESDTEVDYKDIYINLAKDIDSEDDIVITEKISDSCISIYELLNNLPHILYKNRHGYEEKIDLYKSNLESYDFTTITLTDYPIEIATDVFTRLNTGGTILTLFDIMVAKTYDEEKKFNLADKFLNLKENGDNSLQKANYDTITGIIPVYGIAAILKGELKRKSILSISKTNFVKTWPKMESSLKEAVDFLRSKLGIPVSQLLPYISMLVPFTYFFSKYNGHQPSRKHIKLLKQLFYWIAMTSRYSSSSESKIAADIKKIDSIIDEDIPDYGNEMISINSNDISKMQFSTGNAKCKGILCLLASNKPKSLKNGEDIILDNSYLRQSNSRNYHHFFPRAWLKKNTYNNEINIISNIIYAEDDFQKYEIAARSPKKYIEKLMETNDKMKDTLKSHLIKSDFGIEENDYDKFIAKRSELISNELNKILSLKS